MDNLIKTEEYKGYTIELRWDTDPDNPRDWECPDVIYCARRDFKCDKRNINEICDEYTNRLSKEFLENNVWLWIDYYEHGGIALSTRIPGNKRRADWDCGVFGVIAISKDDIKKETGHKIVTKSDREQYMKMLDCRVEEYDNYVNGDVYGYVVKDEDDNEIDSCWGYYGNFGDDCISEAKSVIDSEIERIKKQEDEYANKVMVAEMLCEPFWID